ncbi:hypothetical protein AYI69_g8431 [Smittium culicis]|uniref:Uncharacterized protein n=1 Tax=Smittium culicis TaxID=133412 RepID=A0A1R1XJM2_9FUNG|nr:hypothetical protein AYI69_g8431 [Smittium culicis]
MWRCRTQDGDLGTNLSHDLRIQGSVCDNRTQDVLQDPGSWTQCQRQEIVYIRIPVYHKSGDGNKHSVNDFEGSGVQYPGSSMRGQQTTECFPDEIDMSDELYRESSISVNRSPTWTSYASKILGTQQLLFFDIEITRFDS